MTSGRLTARQKLGNQAEELAVGYLRARGLTILERNVRCRLGELDIVAREGNVLVIAEVRTRTSRAFGGSAASVDIPKQRRLMRASSYFLQRHRELASLSVRFDVLAVSGISTNSVCVEWIRHAFTT